MSLGAWVLVVAVVVAVLFGGYRAMTEGRFRGTRRVGEDARAPAEADAERGSGRPVPAEDPTWAALRDALGHVERGERGTLVQFSSAFCAPCRATRRVLSDVAGIVPGVVHVEVDAEHHLELVRTLGIARTPTTLVLDPHGGEKTRAVGAPRREQVLQALAAD